MLQHGLFLAEQVVELDKSVIKSTFMAYRNYFKVRDPVLREAIKKIMEILSEEFVSGIDIETALENLINQKFRVHSICWVKLLELSLM